MHENSAAVRDLERHQPAVLNAIASTNGTTRLLRRELESVRIAGEQAEDRITGLEERIAAIAAIEQRLADSEQRLADSEQRLSQFEWIPQAVKQVRTDFEPHVETLKWLAERVETVRAEMLFELRYGRDHEDSGIEAKIIRPDLLGDDDNDLRLNLGCGHIPLENYVNVDIRELPGVDIVAAVDDIPIEPASVAEIFSAHVLEHFPELELSRRLLPYWLALLQRGGTFRAVVPDLASMIEQFQHGEIDFEALRQVAYGGQEYEGDFHFTAFTPSSLDSLLSNAGFVDIEVVESARPNGECLEFEITARRPL